MCASTVIVGTSVILIWMQYFSFSLYTAFSKLKERCLVIIVLSLYFMPINFQIIVLISVFFNFLNFFSIYLLNYSIVVKIKVHLQFEMVID